MTDRRTLGPAGWLAVWFGAGLSPTAPGTVGSIAALPFGVALLWSGGTHGWILLTAAALILLPIGAWAAGKYDRDSGGHDSSAIVIDEVVGQWLAMVPIAWSVWWHILLAFGLFRLFDVLKPWPVRWLDRQVPGGWGVMIDDVVAGMLAGFLAWLYIDPKVFG